MKPARYQLVGFLLLGSAGAAALSAVAEDQSQTGLKTENFDRDPGWDGVRNRVKLPAIRKQQNFGYQTTNHAGQAPGEIGGVVWRSLTPAYFGKPIGPFTWDDSLSAAGTITCLAANTGRGWQTGSTVWVGFFNSREQGWRPINSMGFRLETHTDTEAKKIENRPGVEFGYGTSMWTAGGAHVNTTGEEQFKNVLELDQKAMRRIPPDGSKHTWELRYDPAGNNRAGQLILTLDGVESVCNIPQAHRDQGVTFDRFGIFNNQIAGDLMEVYLDDITINGEAEDFATDPGWDGKGNHDLVVDIRLYGAQDFGFSSGTHHAGGARAGELGGRFQSVDPWDTQFEGYYGDRVGPLTMEHRLVARGKFSSENEFSVDSTFALGWFSSAERGWPLKNFIGVFFDSLSDTGRIVQPLYGTKEGSKERGAEMVTFLPNGTNYDWTLEYDPRAAGGRGKISFTMNDQSCSMLLEQSDRQKGATFDRFGVVNLSWANCKHCEVYLDDLTYTASAPE